MSTDETPDNVRTCTPSSEVDMEMTSDQASVGQARSTLADAMAPPKTRVVTYSTDGLDSSLPEMETTKETTPAPLSIKSRDLIREYFAERRPINLPQGHPVIVFIQDQMSSVLRIVADETAKASYDMLNSVVVRVSRLNLGSGQSNAQTEKQQTKSSLSGFTESATDLDSSRPATPAYSGTSRELTS